MAALAACSPPTPSGTTATPAASAAQARLRRDRRLLRRVGRAPRRQLRVEPRAASASGDTVAVLAHMTGTRPDGRAPGRRAGACCSMRDGVAVAVDQYIGDPAAVEAFWALTLASAGVPRSGDVARRAAPDRLRRSMAVAREATPVSSAADIKQADLDREDLLSIYRNMLITRGIEERGHILYRQGKIPGSFYTGRGNEGAVGRRRDRDAGRRRRHADPARHGRARHPRHRAVADLRPVHGPRATGSPPARTATCTWPTSASG